MRQATPAEIMVKVWGVEKGVVRIRESQLEDGMGGGGGSSTGDVLIRDARHPLPEATT